MMRVIHITDLHLGNDRTTELKAIQHLSEKVQYYSPDAVLITGDLVNKATPESFRWAKGCIKRLGPNVKVVPGDRDCDSKATDTRALFKKYFGPTYYSFDIEKVHFIGLDTAGDGVEKAVCYGLDDKQAKWLAEDLAEASQHSNSIVIFTHMEWTRMVSEAKEQLKQIVSNYPVQIYLSGHAHFNKNETSQPMNCYVTSAALDLPDRITDPPSMRLLSNADGKWKEELLPIGHLTDTVRKRSAQTVRKIVDDFHVHTNYSRSAQENMQPDIICQRAAELNLSYIGFTDHLYKHTTYDDVIKLRKAVDKVNGDGTKAFFSLEVELANVNETTLPASWRDQLDYVLLALDHASGPAMPVPLASDIEKWIERYRIGYQVAGKSGVDVLVHPFSGCPKALDLINDKKLIEMLHCLADGEVAIEMNAVHLARHRGKADYGRLYRLARDIGLLFSTGSDAHRLEDFGRTRELNLWLDKLNIDDSMLWRPRRVDQEVMGV
jgi:histidinol phosphatase-like PHP family hydrolase/predicted phosphodiesterase